MASKLKERVGLRYGMLTVLEQFTKNKRTMVVCLCDCGNKKTVRADHAENGYTSSCGCYGEKYHVTHGMTGTSEYRTYDAILRRCYNDTCAEYINYGARGIVCEWGKFEDFFEDMGPKPSSKHTIERIDVNGNYCKENCIWTDDRGLQSYNSRKQSSNTSGRTGVSLTKSGTWAVEIRKDGKKIYLGTYDDFELACFVREEAELKYYGFTKE